MCTEYGEQMMIACIRLATETAAAVVRRELQRFGVRCTSCKGKVPTASADRANFRTVHEHHETPFYSLPFRTAALANNSPHDRKEEILRGMAPAVRFACLCGVCWLTHVEKRMVIESCSSSFVTLRKGSFQP
jgi:hypothetical protein